MLPEPPPGYELETEDVTIDGEGGVHCVQIWKLSKGETARRVKTALWIGFAGGVYAGAGTMLVYFWLKR